MKFLAVYVLAIVCAGLVAAEPPAAPVAFSGSGFDFVVFLSKTLSQPVAIDPSVLRKLSETTVNASVPSIGPARQLLESELDRHGFAIQSVSLAPGIEASFVTTPAAWSYFSAVAAIRQDNFKPVYEVLRSVPADDSEFGRHCGELLQALDAIAQSNADIRRFESELRAAAEKFKLAKDGFAAAELAANAARSHAEYRRAIGPAEARYRAATEEANKAYASVRTDLDRFIGGDGAIHTRFRKVQSANLQSEALFLAVSIEQTYSRLRSLLDWMSREVPVSSTNAPADVAKQLRAERLRLAERVEEAEHHAKAGAVFIASDPEKAQKLFRRAFDADSSALVTRAGLGYCQIQRIIDGLKFALEPHGLAQIESRRQSLEREFRRHSKLGYLRALYEAQRRPVPPLGTTARAKTGSHGAIKAVDAVPRKIAGALTSDGVELVIVPKENEPDLLFVPADQLCRLTIIVADDVNAYLSDARVSDDQQQTERAIHQLRLAQMGLLLGEHEIATKLLQSVESTHPEIYNARRLLELLRIQQQSEGSNRG